MGTTQSDIAEERFQVKYNQYPVKMATRSLRNQPLGLPAQQKPGRAAASKGFGRKILGDITSGQNIVTSNTISESEEKKSKVLNNAQESESMDVDIEIDSLPAGVVDIASKALDNPQLCAEYVTDTFAYLRGLERQTLVGGDHLAGQPTNDKMRAVLVDWLVEVQVQFKLLQETLFSTIDIIDRFIAREGS